MTTLVATRQPLHNLSMSSQAGRRQPKRPTAAIDLESDDDFQFVRKSKKQKTDDAHAEKKTIGRPSKGRASRGANNGEHVGEPAEGDGDETGARPMQRNRSSGTTQVESELKIPKRRANKAPRAFDEVMAEETSTTAQKNGTAMPGAKGRGKAQETTQRNMDLSPPLPAEFQSKIALPMSDTPIINRNKEMRKKGTGARRSSLGSRGRRASSLIESGQAAIPHKDVGPQEFYKHIESQSLPEPRRMKQLLTWCGERALSEKPAHGTMNAAAVHGARAIQDQLLKDFASRNEFSNWFDRDSSTTTSSTLRPNPKNLELDEKVQSLEQKIARLQREKEAWLAIRQPTSDIPPLFPPADSDQVQTFQVILPDFDLLDSEDGSMRSFLSDSSLSFSRIRKRTEKRLQTIQTTLEFQIDQLADNVHKLEQRVAVGGKEADRVLMLGAARLRERETRERRGAGTKDMPIIEVLRSLSSILPEGGG